MTTATTHFLCGLTQSHVASRRRMTRTVRVTFPAAWQHRRTRRKRSGGPVSSLTAKIPYQNGGTRLGAPPADSPQRTYEEAQVVLPFPPGTGRGVQNELFLEFKNGACVLSRVSRWQPGCLFSLRPPCRVPPLCQELLIYIPPSDLAYMHLNFVEAAHHWAEREGGVLHPDLIPQSTRALLIAPRLSCFH